MQPQPVIRVFHNLARSGGTLVCRCIGAMKNVRLLSEIHPAANHVAYLNAVDQAHRWYGLVSQADVDASLGFVAGIEQIVDSCHNAGMVPVLRDWATVDFMGRLLVEEPVFRFSLDKALSERFQVVSYGLVRHPLDQWLSTRRLKVYAGKLDESAFFRGYRRYAELVQGQFVRYEDFTCDPENAMRQIARGLQLSYDPGFIIRWQDNHCITGDNKGSSRGSAGSGEIRPLPRREVDPVLEAGVANNPDYQEIIRLLGY